MTATEALFQFVVVGSSAGGIEALSTLVATLPSPFPVPLIIAQHLNRERPSHLAQILTRHSTIPVVLVEQREELKANTVYVVPANHHVEISEHDISTLPHIEGRPKPSIDLLLSSAAEVYGEKLIAVILTGGGSDGTAGAQTVHETGGTVVIQNPATAAYPSMPGSLAPETVDIVTELDNIGPILFDLINGKPMPHKPDEDSDGELELFLDAVREHTGIDFRTYKPTTIIRRLERRMVNTGSTDLQDYTLYLKSHPEEYKLLTDSFLIKVTEFMRDPDLFAHLHTQILSEVVKYSEAHHKELRFWSAGCATGEEAYSLAMLLCEVVGEKLKEYNIKIFATDLDAISIASARRGIYTATSLDRVPKELVEKYFTPNKDGYEIKKSVRDLIVFGEHDLGQRAPFPNIDLILCRNVLIYFSRELQHHALQLFAFALRENGFLVLGRTETTSPLPDFFATEEVQQRIYRRSDQPFSPRNIKPLTKPNLRPPWKRVVTRGLPHVQHEAHTGRAAQNNLLQKLPIGVVIVDKRFDIQEINSAARRLLSIHTSVIGEDFVHLAHYIAPRELSTAITKAISENVVTTLDRLEVPDLSTGEATFLELTCYPHPVATGVENGNIRLALILVTDITMTLKCQHELEEARIQSVKVTTELSQNSIMLTNTKAELLETQRDLVKTRDQAAAVSLHQAHQMELLVNANQGLLWANEELTSLNGVLRADSEENLVRTEEAQAAIEEADTLNEEMQATNEEFDTLNEELQATIEELHTSNADLIVQTEELHLRTEQLKTQGEHIEEERAQLATILASMTDALIVVNSANKILLTNATYDQIFGMENGLELWDGTGITAIKLEETPRARAARGEVFNMTFSFKSTEGNRHWWEAISQPLEWKGMPACGLVVMRDITERSLRNLQEQFLSMISHELRTPLTVVKGQIQMSTIHLKKLEGDFEKPLRNLNLALGEVERLHYLINDILDVSRLETGKFGIEFKELHLDILLAQTVDGGQMLVSGQELTLNNTSGTVLIKGDAQRLQQVIFNLINNAVIHAPNSGKIELSLDRIDNDMVEIRVQDYGMGIKAKYLPELFSRFYQVVHRDGTTTKGLGLGLFIARQIISEHKGTIRVESIEGVGTTFIIALPELSPNAQSLSRVV